MDQELTTSVLVAGGGPVGLTLAMDLAWRGIDVVLVEQRAPHEPPEPKCNHTSARSMEIFRRLGVAGKLRNAGLPADYPNDASYRTSFTGRELTRIPIPARRFRYDATDGPDTAWPTPEPPHRINQIFLEPILFDHAAQMSRIRILSRTRLEGFDQHDDRVTVTVRDLVSGDETRIDCAYLVGCDGGRSLVRRNIGATFQGDAEIQRVQSTYIKAPDLIRRQSEAPAWSTFSLNRTRSGNVYAIDGIERWIVHNYLRPDEKGFDSVDRDWAIRAILGVGDDFEYDVIQEMDWFGRRLVADRFRERRVFICGDAAHIWVPYAGYGMNAGIADAVNLSWLLAAHLNGWAPPGILDAYERERMPITEQVSHFVMNHAHAMASQRGAVPEDIDLDGPLGDAVRKQFGETVYALNVQQYCCGGLNFGYFYDASPIIAYDGEKAPPYTMADFRQTSVPGCRTPHLWVGNGRSLYDAMGPEYTLLCFDPDQDVAPLEKAARAKKVPLRILPISDPDAAALYDRTLVISRPDQHVAWRGNALPDDPGQLIDKLRGAAP